jgi:hypothetical protein
VCFAAITLCVASRVFIVVVYFVTTQSGNFWIRRRMPYSYHDLAFEVIDHC